MYGIPQVAVKRFFDPDWLDTITSFQELDTGSNDVLLVMIC